MTITLAQAAVFLIRINKASAAVQAIVNLDPSVVAHYLKMSVNLLESGDLSETRLSTYLAKTIRDVSRAAGIAGIAELSPPPRYSDPEAPESHPHRADSYLAPLTNDNTATGSARGGFDLDNFLQVDSQLDLGYLLGLPGDNNSVVAPSLLGGLGSTGNGGLGGMSGAWNPEFGFGLGLDEFGGMAGNYGLGFSEDSSEQRL
jgi:hypothetical protein